MPENLAEDPGAEGEGPVAGYLNLLKRRLAGGYNTETAPQLGEAGCSLYARSHVTVGKYIFHKSVAYETMELNEHVFVRVQDRLLQIEDIDRFVQDLKTSIELLVKPSYEHMSSAVTGILVSETEIPADVRRRIEKVAYTRHFWLGLRGWSFLRLLGVDLSTRQVYANRRGKEVLKAYNPG